MITQYSKPLVAFSVLASLVACGGGSAPSQGPDGGIDPAPDPTISMSATFVKGLVANGQCSLFSISAAALSTTAVAMESTDAAGVARFNNVAVSGPVLVECSGGSYTDEATGQSLVPPALRAVVDTGANTAPVVSPITEIATLRAEQDAAGLLSAISSYNADNSLGLDATAVIPTDLQSAAAGDDAAGQYAILLAVISQLAATAGADTPAELTSLIDDWGAGKVADADIAQAITDLTASSSTAANNISAVPLSVVAGALDLVINIEGTVTILGDATEAETLTATVQDQNGLSNNALSFQWLADSVNIPGATGSSYRLAADDVGKQVTLTVSYTDDDGFSEQLTSAATVTVAAIVMAADDLGWGSADSVPVLDCSSVVNTLPALEAATSLNMAAGTTVCLADGVYSSDLALKFGGIGTLAEPITVAAQNPGGAIISGASVIRMSGEYVVLQGLVFKDGQSDESDLIQTRTSANSADWCHYCRITEVSIVDVGEANSDSGKWINVYGHHNRIDHNWFAGKANIGALLVINREADKTNPANTEVDFAQVDHNYFGDRPPVDGKAYADGSDNGFEAIRTGTSDSHAFDSFSVYENNFFERIDGEAEVISNKAGNNRISNNTVRDSFGSITLRHGASAVVANNFMMGDGHPFAAGIRIIDDSHRVVNNYIQGARYLNTRFHGAIVVHNGNGSTSNGYQNVENVLIAHNTIVDSVNSLNFHGGRESTDPTNIFFVNNIIDDAVGHLINQPQHGLPHNSSYAGNYYQADTFSDDGSLTAAAGFIERDAQLAIGSDGLFRPDSANGPDLSAVLTSIGNFDAIDDDMDGQTRSAQTVSGADEASTQVATFGILTRGDVGPINYTPPESVGYVIRHRLVNYGFDDGTTGWTLSAGAVITNTVGEVFARGASVKISGAGRLSQVRAIDANTNYTLSAFVQGGINLGVVLGGQESSSTSANSSYRFETHSFNSGANTSVTLFADLPASLTQNMAFVDEFRLVAHPSI